MAFSSGKRILVTGASGLLGLNLSLEAAADHAVYGVVNSHPLRTDAFTVLSADLLASSWVEDVLKRTKPDWIVNCAALADVDASEKSPELAHRLNTELPGHLAAAAARTGARFLHISTDAVFDGQRGDYTEADEPNPLSVYAQTKLAGERAVAETNPDALIARVNFYGWSLSGKRSLAEFFFYNLSTGKPVKGFTDVYFCPLLVNDLAHILLRMLEKELTSLYHVVSSECLTKYDFGHRIARQFGLDESLITPTSVSAGGLSVTRSPNLTLRSDKLAQALAAPLPDIASGLTRFHDLYTQGYPQQIQAMFLQGSRPQISRNT